MTETIDRSQAFDFDETPEMVATRYRLEYPLLAAYEDVVDEHTVPRASINEPAIGGIDQEKATGLALDRIGRPARDREDVVHALAFIDRLYDEMATVTPQEKNIRDHVVGAFFSLAGYVPRAEEWTAHNDSDRASEVDEVMQGIPTDDLRRLLRETLEIAMPEILRRITAEHDNGRRRATLRLS